MRFKRLFSRWLRPIAEAMVVQWVDTRLLPRLQAKLSPETYEEVAEAITALMVEKLDLV
jgi:methylthioribose-1-phosphate isomerase